MTKKNLTKIVKRRRTVLTELVSLRGDSDVNERALFVSVFVRCTQYIVKVFVEIDNEKAQTAYLGFIFKELDFSFVLMSVKGLSDTE